MEISKEMLDQSMALVESHKLTTKLNTLYASIPSGKCNACAKCCHESVHAFYIEFLNIYDYVIKNGMLDQVMTRVEDHYFNELVKHQACPFLGQDNACMIYPVRPYVCRLFGHDSRASHEENYKRILAQNEEADRYFFEVYGVHLKDEVIYHKIDFCEDFEPENHFSHNEKMALIDDLFMLDTKFLIDDILPEDMLNMSITNWFVYTRYEEEDASMKRIENLTNGKL